ncbi:MAG: hypothetical protein K2J68_08080 [Treponemataceae bacterium]|nr:hypothetical protein [Treponemataceae bacterium]
MKKLVIKNGNAILLAVFNCRKRGASQIAAKRGVWLKSLRCKHRKSALKQFTDFQLGFCKTRSSIYFAFRLKLRAMHLLRGVSLGRAKKSVAFLLAMKFWQKSA